MAILSIASGHIAIGLIIPMWNWNPVILYYDFTIALLGLIIPMWNWNHGEFNFKYAGFGD